MSTCMFLENRDISLAQGQQSVHGGAGSGRGWSVSNIDYEGASLNSSKPCTTCYNPAPYGIVDGDVSDMYQYAVLQLRKQLPPENGAGSGGQVR